MKILAYIFAVLISHQAFVNCYSFPSYTNTNTNKKTKTSTSTQTQPKVLKSTPRVALAPIVQQTTDDFDDLPPPQFSLFDSISKFVGKVNK